MSESSRHEEERELDCAPDLAGEDILGGARSQESFDAELEAELADHLAASSAELAQQGESSEKAMQTALANFGDISRIKRQCWWIHHGEDVMFRASGIALLSILTIGVALLAAGGWQVQRSLATRTEELSAQLASLASTQEAMLAQQRPPEIAGLCYLGDRTKPAANAEVEIFRFSEEPSDGRKTGVVVRRIRTDAQGRFESGILQSGEYCLLAPFYDPAGRSAPPQLVDVRQKVDSPNDFVFGRMQSQPVYLVTGADIANVDLDLLASASVQIVVQNIPETVSVGGNEVKIFAQIVAATEGPNKYFQRHPVPMSDDAPREGWPLPLAIPPNIIPYGLLSASATTCIFYLPPREYDVMVSLALSTSHAVAAGTVNPSNAHFWTSAHSKRVVLRKDEPLRVVISIPEPLQQRVQAAYDGVDRVPNFPAFVGGLLADAEFTFDGQPVEPVKQIDASSQ